MVSTLRQRNFRLLWLGGFLSDIGNMALIIALPFYVYTLTRSALATGGMFIAQVVPSLLLGSVAGVLTDRWNRKWTLVSVEASRTLLMLMLLLVNTPNDVWVVYLVVFVESAIGMLYDPARHALIPRLIGNDHVLAANALTSMSGQLTGLIAPLFGAALFGVIGFHGIVLFDSASYLLGAILVAGIMLPPASPMEAQRPLEQARPWMTVWQEFMAGLRLVLEETWITVLFVVMSIIMLAQGIIHVLFIPYISDVLRGGAQELAWIVTAQGCGGLIGSVVIGRFGQRLPSVWMIAIGIWVTGIGWFVIANTASLTTVIVINSLTGMAAAGVLVTVPTLLQGGVPDAYRGRVFGTLGTIQAVFLLIGQGTASVLGDRLGVRVMFIAVAVLTLLAGSVAVLYRTVFQHAAQHTRDVITPELP